MKIIRGLDLINNTEEEQLPDYTHDFPCITTRAELYQYPNALVPWHWHYAAELIYMVEGSLDYHFPGHDIHIECGSGGLLLPGILHRSTWEAGENSTVLVQLFDPAFLFGNNESRMGKKYIEPLIGDPKRSFLDLNSSATGADKIIEAVKHSFEADEMRFDYEYTLRDSLCRIWLMACMAPDELWLTTSEIKHNDRELRQIISFINSHFKDALSVDDLARYAHISKRTCFRLFRDVMHTTPVDYIRSVRIRKACTLLTGTHMSATEIAFSVGFDSLSYFDRIFQKYTNYSPTEFREWHDRSIT